MNRKIITVIGIGILIIMGSIAPPVFAANKTWDGGSGGDSNWQTGDNWDNNIAPSTYDALYFAGSTRLTPSNNYAANTQFNGITFNSGAGAFTLSGNDIKLGGNITNSSSNTQTMGLGMALQQDTTIDTGSGGITLNSTMFGISGMYNLVKSGSGLLTIKGSNSYFGTTTISAGSLLLDISGSGTGLGMGKVIDNGTIEFRILSSTTVGNNIEGTGGLNQTVPSTTTLSGTNTYTGATNISGGTIKLGSSGGLPSTSAVTLTNTSTLDLNGNNGSIGSLAGQSTGKVTNSGMFPVTLTIGGNNSSTNFFGYIENGSGGAVSLTKVGNGTLDLVDAQAKNTYSGTTTISGGTLIMETPNGGGNIIDNAALVFSTGNMTVSNAISGTGSVTYTGHNIITLNSNTTYAGATTINCGTLKLGMFGAIPDNSAVTISDSGVPIFPSKLDLNGKSETIGSLAGTTNTTVTSGAAGAVTLTAGGNDTSTAYAGIIENGSGTVSLTKTGTGNLGLSGTNTYTGVTTFAAGILGVSTIGNGGVAGNLGAASSAAGNLVFDGGALACMATGSTDRNFTINPGKTAIINLGASADLTISGAAAATTGGLTVNANNQTLTLSGNNLYTGATTVNSGTLKLGAAGVISDSSAVTVANGATLNLNGFTETVGSLAGSGNVYSGGFGATLITGADNTSTVFSGVLQNVPMITTLALTKTGTGTLTLTGANTYGGTTTISAGTLQVGSGGTTGTLGTAGVINNAALVFDRSNDLTVSNVISGTGTLTKAGAGTLTLSGANTYTGATTISSGTLKLSGLGSVSYSPLINVASSAHLDASALTNFSLASGQTIKGSGTVATGASGLTIPEGSVVAPGNSIGTLRVDGMTIEGTYDVEITETEADKIIAELYDLVLDNATLNIIYYGGAFDPTGLSWMIGEALVGDVTLSGTTSFTGTGGYTFTVETRNGGKELWLNGPASVPEPATVVGLALAAFAAALRRRSRR